MQKGIENGINVLTSIGRIYVKILKERVEENFQDHEEQNGFRSYLYWRYVFCLSGYGKRLACLLYTSRCV